MAVDWGVRQSPNFPELRRFNQWALAFRARFSGEYRYVSETRLSPPISLASPMNAFAGTPPRTSELRHCHAPAVAAGVSAAASCVRSFCRAVSQALLITVLWLQAESPVSAQADPKPAEPAAMALDLLAADLKQGWKAYPAESLEGADPDWTILREPGESEPILICRGRMKGFLWTLEKWQDFEFTGEWKYPQDNDGNSGILVHTQREDRIWPTAIQIQLHQPKAGSIFPGGDAMTDNMLEAADGLARPINSWNECRVVCQNGRISVEINGRRAGEVTGARPAGGHLALQSEGSEVHFRKLRIRRLAAGESAAPGAAAAPEGQATPAAVK